MSVLDWLEIARIEVFIEIGLAFRSDPVETAGDLRNEAISSKYRESVAGVASDRTAEIFDSLRREVSLLTKQLKNPIIAWDHPIRGLSHRMVCVRCQTHSSPGCSAVVLF